MRHLLLLCLGIISTTILAQDPALPSPVDRLRAGEQRAALLERSLTRNLPFEAIGPTVFSGRVVDIAVDPADPTHFYVAYASGGLWETTNNGTSFVPLFDHEAVMTIGAIGVDWATGALWVGTGEVNSSRSSYAGTGLYHSNDGGENWTHRGLADSHHIGSVVVHPTEPNTVWVAVLGHLYTPNEARGVYKTTDGGDSWTQTLYINPNAGAVTLITDAADPERLYAATWERTRRAWDFTESGPGSGVYRSTDGGNNWTHISDADSGFPSGEGTGRIGVARHPDGTLYTVLDNYNRRPKEADKKQALTKDELRDMTEQRFLGLEENKVADFLRANRFPDKYDYAAVRQLVEAKKITPAALVEYLEDANSLLFDTPVVGAEVYKSTDDGDTWTKTHDGYLDYVYNSYGYYFGEIQVDPRDADRLYIMGVPILMSEDGGASWRSIIGENVHVDHHALWSNPARSGHLILGNDGGIHITYDYGANWMKCNAPPVGQFYAIAYDRAEPYRVYGGLQDNGVWMAEHTAEVNTEWLAEGQNPWRRIMGGDGMQVAVDTRDNRTVYTGYQFGNYFRLNTQTDERKYITPKHELGERPLRWNWQTPVQLSPHNQDIFYMCSNKVHRSFDRGDSFATISPDLTGGGRPGDVAFGTITTFHESPLKFGLLYAGTDDGRLHVSRDAGTSWQRIDTGLPADKWVTRVRASSREPGRVYATLNGYRDDDFRTLAYRSDDYGSSWQAIFTEVRAEPVNDICEDPANPELLYLGTDHALYVSLDGGATAQVLTDDLPYVAVHDVEVQPDAKDLIVGTHGRSVYVGSVAELQQLTAEKLAEPLVLFAPDEVRYSSRWGNDSYPWNEPDDVQVELPLYTKAAGDLVLEVVFKDEVIATRRFAATAGLHRYAYDLQVDENRAKAYRKLLDKETAADFAAAESGGYYLRKGEYTLRVKGNGATREVALVVK